MTLPTLYISVALGFLSLARGFAEINRNTAPKWIIGFGVLWLFAARNRWKWFPTPALFLCIFLSVIGVANGASLHWMAAGALASLIFWDISNFRLQMFFLPKGDDSAGLERRHFLRLMSITFIALLFVTFLGEWYEDIESLWYFMLSFIFILSIYQMFFRR